MSNAILWCRAWMLFASWLLSKFSIFEHTSDHMQDRESVDERGGNVEDEGRREEGTVRLIGWLILHTSIKQKKEWSEENYWWCMNGSEWVEACKRKSNLNLENLLLYSTKQICTVC